MNLKSLQPFTGTSKSKSGNFAEISGDGQFARRASTKFSTRMTELPPDFDIYAFLNIEATATETEVVKAYRKLSLLYHPDKNPSPDVVQKFHYLSLCREILLSPTARAAYDNVRKAKAAKAERTAKYDDERRRLQRDLEDREREAKRRKFESGRTYGVEEAENLFKQEIEKLKEESERLKRERDRKMQENLDRQDEQDDPADEDERTIKVRFRKGTDRNLLSTDKIEALFSTYGKVENVLLGKSALVVFETAVAAKAAAEGFMKSDDPAVGVIKEITMAQVASKGAATKDRTNTDHESRKFPILQPPVTKSNPPAVAPKFSFKPTAGIGSGADYESITLLRMRKIEKEKLEKEIREREEREMGEEC